MRASRTLIGVFAVLVLFLGVVFVVGCGGGEDVATPEEVYQQFEEATEAEDMETIQSLLVSNVRMSVDGSKVGEGFLVVRGEDVFATIEGSWAEEGTRTVENVEVSGDTVTVSSTWTSDRSGTTFTNTEHYTVKDGQITNWEIIREETTEAS